MKGFDDHLDNYGNPGLPSEDDLDNQWYEAFADYIHSIGKAWPQELTTGEYDAAERYADSKVRRPVIERDPPK